MLRFTTSTCQACFHRENSLLSCCTLEETELINANKSTQYYQKGQFIYQEGNQALGLYCICQGKIKLVRAAGDNKEKIVHLLREGETFGYRALLAGTPHSASAAALEDSVVCYIPRPDFLRLVQSNPQFSTALIQQLAKSLGQAEEQMLHLAYKPVRERLAGALLFVMQTFRQEGEELPFRISLSREDLAALVGTAKETVSRLLTELKGMNVIATRGSQITILKPARLVEIATMYD